MSQDPGVVEETLQRIGHQKGVKVVLVTTKDGAIIRTIGSNELAEQCAAYVPQLSELARHVVRDLDPTNDLDFLRIRSKHQELMVAAGPEFNLIVVQQVADPTATHP